MNNIISTVSAAAVLAVSSLAVITPISAAPRHADHQQQDRYTGNFCAQNPHARHCNDWQSNRGRWNNDQYRSFYESHRHNHGFGGNLAAGLFGLAVGTAITGSIGNTNDHVRACEARYHSYSVRTDRFLGYDGLHHLCRL